MGVIKPTVDDFRALARSSPWRWSTLRFTLTRTNSERRRHTRVRAWLRRPDLLRVETLEGRLIQVIRQPPADGVLFMSTGEPSRTPLPLVDDDIQPDGDGLVRQPRGDRSRTAYDAPMFNSYDWVAVLDPVELADGHQGAGTEVRDVRWVDHHGRRSLQAVLNPSGDYAPRCDCCSLLYSASVDQRLADAGLRIDHPEGFAYPDATQVRLDGQTGVCVLTSELGGSRPGRGLELRIEAVDEEMADDLFPTVPSPETW